MIDEPEHITPGGPTAEERNWAMASHLGTAIAVLVGGWFVNILVPLLLWLWKKEQSAFVADHAREELNFQISLTLYVVLAVVLAVLTLGIALLLIIPVAIVFVIVVIYVIIRASLAASRGERYRYPLTMRFVR